MRAAFLRICGASVFSKSGRGRPEEAAAAAFWFPLPAAAFAWWVLIVRPVWMPDMTVRQSVLLGYLCLTLPALFSLVLHPRGAAAASNVFTCMSLLVLGLANYLYPAATGWWLVILGTLLGAAAVVVAARMLLFALRPYPDRRLVNYFLFVPSIVLVVVVGESVLWQAERYNLVRLVPVAICTAMVWAGWPRWRRFSGAAGWASALLGAGMLLALIAELLRLAPAPRPMLAAQLLQEFGGRFFAYFGAGAVLASLPRILETGEGSHDSDSSLPQPDNVFPRGREDGPEHQNRWPSRPGGGDHR